MSTLRSIIIPYDFSRRRLNNHQILAISTPRSKDGCSFLGNNGKLSLLSITPGSGRKSNAKMNMTVYCAELPPNSPSGSWKSWAFGVLMMVILPFVKQNWRSILQIKSDIDKAVEGAEIAAEFVEKVAEEVEKVADQIADDLPEGSKARDVLRRVEDIAKKTDEVAEVAEGIIEKVERIEDEVEKKTEEAMDKTYGKDTESSMVDKNGKEIESAVDKGNGKAETESAMDKDKDNVVLTENVKNNSKL
ncbi:hypothetical protein NE237_016561 [Protea cynaroides]|uniref:Uncharacterized protein n=1 Tax=Protea cynaroides TaxID=273540 RepID=A0A9Q0K6F7_9MAGN|nr:hypothetical protein NE237_016561 [Protea cynaroides]